MPLFPELYRKWERDGRSDNLVFQMAMMDAFGQMADAQKEQAYEMRRLRESVDDALEDVVG